MSEHNSPSDNFGEKPDSHLTPVDSKRELVSVAETREIPDYSQQHIDELQKTIAELKTASEKSSKKYERIIGRLRTLKKNLKNSAENWRSQNPTVC
ncbi:MAG: hypothetical protein AAFR83_25360 [Cyanobacteria bacterium J06629_18]